MLVASEIFDYILLFVDYSWNYRLRSFVLMFDCASSRCVFVTKNRLDIYFCLFFEIIMFIFAT